MRWQPARWRRIGWWWRAGKPGRLRVPAPSLLVIAGLVVARASLQVRIGHTRARIDGSRASEPDGLTDQELRRDLNAAEHAELGRLYDNGTISQATRQQLQRGLDLEAARLSEQR